MSDERGTREAPAYSYAENELFRWSLGKCQQQPHGFPGDWRCPCCEVADKVIEPLVYDEAGNRLPQRMRRNDAQTTESTALTLLRAKEPRKLELPSPDDASDTLSVYDDERRALATWLESQLGVERDRSEARPQDSGTDGAGPNVTPAASAFTPLADRSPASAPFGAGMHRVIAEDKAAALLGRSKATPDATLAACIKWVSDNCGTMNGQRMAREMGAASERCPHGVDLAATACMTCISKGEDGGRARLKLRYTGGCPESCASREALREYLSRDKAQQQPCSGLIRDACEPDDEARYTAEHVNAVYRGAIEQAAKVCDEYEREIASHIGAPDEVNSDVLQATTAHSLASAIRKLSRPEARPQDSGTDGAGPNVTPAASAFTPLADRSPASAPFGAGMHRVIAEDKAAALLSRSKATPDVTVIEMQPSRPKVRGNHVHGCPECYEKVPCDETCSIEIDLFEEGETPCGAYVVCASCQAKAGSKATPACVATSDWGCEARRLLGIARGALTFYADPLEWGKDGDAIADEGKTARDALDETAMLALCRPDAPPPVTRDQDGNDLKVGDIVQHFDGSDDYRIDSFEPPEPKVRSARVTWLRPGGGEIPQSGGVPLDHLRLRRERASK